MNPLPMLMDHLAETDDDLERSLESGFIIMQVNHHHRPPLKGARPTNFPFLYPNHLYPFIHLRRPHLSPLQVQTKRSRLGCPVSSPPFPTTLVGLVVVGLLVPLASRRHRFHRLRSGLPQEGKMNGRSDGIRRDSLNFPTPLFVPVLMKALPTWH